MRDPRLPDTSQDEVMPDLPASHETTRPVNPVPEGISPQDPSSMPRGEEDAETKRNSPEFHDRPGSKNPQR